MHQKVRAGRREGSQPIRTRRLSDINVQTSGRPSHMFDMASETRHESHRQEQ